MGITRRQLKEFGASDYLVKQLTKELQPVGRQGRAYAYDKRQVLSAICDRLDIPKIRETTKAILKRIEVEVSGLVEPFVTNPQLLDAIAEAAKANARFEQTARQAQKTAAEFQDYKKKCSSNFITHNNIVVFKI